MLGTPLDSEEPLETILTRLTWLREGRELSFSSHILSPLECAILQRITIIAELFLLFFLHEQNKQKKVQWQVWIMTRWKCWASVCVPALYPPYAFVCRHFTSHLSASNAGAKHRVQKDGNITQPSFTFIPVKAKAEVVLLQNLDHFPELCCAPLPRLHQHPLSAFQTLQTQHVRLQLYKKNICLHLP